MKKFFDTEKKVKEILEKYPATRSDDWFLLMTFWHLHAPEARFEETMKYENYAING